LRDPILYDCYEHRNKKMTWSLVQHQKISAKRNNVIRQLRTLAAIVVPSWNRTLYDPSLSTQEAVNGTYLRRQPFVPLNRSTDRWL